MLLDSLDCQFLITPSSCCQFLWIVCFLLPLRLVYPMLPESLDCPFLITPSSCVPYDASFSRLLVLYYPFVLCTLCCQFFWIVSFDYPFVLLPVSLDCLFFITPLSCVPYATSFSGLSVSDYPFVLCTLCCQFLSIVSFVLPLRLVYPMLPVSLDCPFLIIPSSCVPNVASFSGLSVSDYPFVLCTLCSQFLWIVVFDYPFVLCTLCYQFLWIVRFLLPLRLVYPMLPVSLDCPFLITPSSCVPYVTSFSGLSVSDYPFVLWNICCQFLSIVSFVLPLRLVYPILPVSLDCQILITPSSCVPYVASFSGLSVFDYPFVLGTLCCQFLWIVRFWLPLRLVYPMLPVSLDCPFLITPSSCVPYVARFPWCPFLITPSSCVIYVTSFSGLSVFDYPFVLCTLCCQFLWIVRFWLPLRLVYTMLPVYPDSPFLITPSSCVPYVASFSGLFVFDYPFVLCTLCCQFLLIVSFWLPLRLVYPMLPVSLDCSFLITPSSCVPYVASFSGLSVFYYPFVLCTLCYQLLWIVSFWLPLRLVYPMLPVSLDFQLCISPSSCVPYVASFSGLSVLITPSSCCQFLWIVCFWLPLRLVYPMLPVSLDCPF